MLSILTLSTLFVHHVNATEPCIVMADFPSGILKDAGLSEKLSMFEKISDTNGCSGQSYTEYNIPDDYSTLGLKYKLDFTFWSHGTASEDTLGKYQVESLQKSELADILDNLRGSIKNIEGNKDITTLINILGVSEGYVSIDKYGNYIDFTGKDSRDTFRIDLTTGKVLRIYIYSVEHGQAITKVFPYISTIQQGDTFKKLSNGRIPVVDSYEASGKSLKIRFEYEDNSLWFMLQDASSSKIMFFDKKGNMLSNDKTYDLGKEYSSYIYLVIKGEITPAVKPVEKIYKVFIWWNPFTWFR